MPSGRLARILCSPLPILARFFPQLFFILLPLFRFLHVEIIFFSWQRIGYIFHETETKAFAVESSDSLERNHLFLISNSVFLFFSVFYKLFSFSLSSCYCWCFFVLYPLCSSNSFFLS